MTASHTESLTARAGWLTFAKAAGFVFSLALPLLVVRRMNPDQVGIYKQVFLIVTTAMSILPLGVHMSAYYFLPRESDRRQQTVLNIMLFLTTVGALGCCVLVFYPQVLTVVFYQQGLTQYSRLIGLTLLLWILGTFLENVPIANEEIRLATVLIIASQATRAMVFLAAVSIWGTVQALILAAIIHGLIQTGVLFWYLESRFPGFWHSFDWPMLRRQMSYAVPLGTAATLFALQTDLHNYFVSHSFPPAIFAIYSYGTLQLPLMGLIGEAVNSVLITRVSVLQQENKNREIIRLIVRAGRKLAVVYFAAYALLLVVGPELIKLLFTNRYAESWPVFAVNLTLLPLNILMLDAIFRAYASQRFFFLWLRLGIILAQVFVLLLWTRQLGLVGVISVVVATAVIERAAMVVRLGRLLGVRREDFSLLRDIGKLALAALVTAIVCLVVRLLLAGSTPFLILAGCGVVFMIVYLTLIYLLRIPVGREFEQIRVTFASCSFRSMRSLPEWQNVQLKPDPVIAGLFSGLMKRSGFVSKGRVILPTNDGKNSST